MKKDKKPPIECRKCKKVRPVSSFAPTALWCAECRKEYQFRYKLPPRPRRTKTFVQVEYQWKRNGILNKQGEPFTVTDYSQLKAEQQEQCAICGKKPKKRPLGVDHNHTTGTARGLLCIKCNSGIGLLGDSVETLSIAKEYLERFI